jgi:hypothetical protein
MGVGIQKQITAITAIVEAWNFKIWSIVNTWQLYFGAHVRLYRQCNLETLRLKKVFRNVLRLLVATRPLAKLN